MGSPTPTTTSLAKPEPIDLEAGLPTSAEDVTVLRELRAGGLPEELGPRLLAVSATRLFRWLPPRKTTSKGWEPFEL